VIAAVRTARARIRDRQQQLGTHLCVGLDPVPERMPRGLALGEFCAAIVEATAPYACAFKPNAAFFEAEGLAGWAALEQVVAHARALDVPVVLDGKRGDVGSTAIHYARAAFDTLGADALTVSPYLGREAITPILEYNEAALTYVLCATSNPGAQEIQGHLEPGSDPLYLHVARIVQQLSTQYPNVGLVVGATRPEAMRAIRHVAPDVAWLVPGIGAQGGDLAAVANAAPPDAVFCVSRTILYAAGGERFDGAAASAAREFRDAYNRHRSAR
jgi:orotidine-5'-phosphate decarboxylase